MTVVACDESKTKTNEEGIFSDGIDGIGIISNSIEKIFSPLLSRGMNSETQIIEPRLRETQVRYCQMQYVTVQLIGPRRLRVTARVVSA